MLGLTRYLHWLHTRWPAGTVEKLPAVGPDGSTSVPGIRVVGDLTGIPLLKFSADTGARAVRAIRSEPGFVPGKDPSVLDLAIIGGGVSGIAAALEAQTAGLDFAVFEAVQPFSTIVNFPKGKPIYTYPTEMVPAGDMRFTATVKEPLLAELETQRAAAGIEPVNERIERVEKRDKEFLLHRGAGREPVRAQRVIVAIGRSGNYRKLKVPGEAIDKVYNRLYDPKDHCGQRVLVVGGGDSALETAIALAICGAHVTLSYRKAEFSRPKPGNIEKLEQLRRDPTARTAVERPVSERVNTAIDATNSGAHAPGSITLMMESTVKEIRADKVLLVDADQREIALENDVVFVMIGREAPLDFFRRSGIRIRGEWNPTTWVAFLVFFTFCLWLYHWKADYLVPLGLQPTFNQYLGLDPAAAWDAAGTYFNTPGTLGHTLKISASGRSFYYTFVYCLCVLVFGIDRVRRKRTPYVKWQTLVLTAVQWLPLFILPEIVFPWLGHNGWFDGGIGKWFADAFFPAADYGHGREYWRAYGFVLAWPLMAWNWFTAQPLWGWLVVGSLQTFVIIPLIIYRWGKGAYCGWICSCGALAETLGDRHRHKMPHGPLWNRLNMIGQGFLAFAVILMLLRILGWAGLGWARTAFDYGSQTLPLLNYAWFVDLVFAGVLGVGLYFWFSGRVWCRFACPLAALMHLYARFSRFRIFPEKSKCISCNVCTSVCHQGIDVMNFANKGLPMQDPQCVRCSACVQECPTGVLRFGRFDDSDRIMYDKIPASAMQMQESRSKPTA